MLGHFTCTLLFSPLPAVCCQSVGGLLAGWLGLLFDHWAGWLEFVIVSHVVLL
jgi:hypothetical protein